MWDHPWAAVATAGVTSLPPPIPVLADGVVFHCYPGYPSDVGAWIVLIGTHWTPADLLQRLEGTWICELTVNGVLVATCVLRPMPLDPHANKWILETLVSRQKGSAYPLINSAFRWIYDLAGPFSLFFTWELSLWQLGGAYFKGWLRAARAVHCTWIWTADCFCRKEGLHVNRARFVMPTVITGQDWSVTVTDSGLEDGWGYVHSFIGTPDWSTVAKRGGWLFLWYYGPASPGPLWGFTSQVVVVGAVNYDGPLYQWLTAEVAST